MPTIKLTRRNVSSLQPAAKPIVWYDVDLKGFGLKIMPSGARSWIVEYRPGAGGRGVAKKRLKVGGDALSPEAARAAAEKLLASVALGSDPSSDRTAEREAMTVSDLLDMFVARHVEVKRKAASAEFYERTARLHIKPAIGSKKVNQLQRADVAKMHSGVATKPKGGGKFVANRALAILSAAYGWAGRNGFVADGFNPAAGIERFEEEGRERYLTAEEMSRLGEALREAETVGLPFEVDEDGPKAKHAPKLENRRTVFSPHVVGAIRLLMLTGCRLREILHLRWSEFDADRGALFLPDSKRGRKTVVLSAAAQEVLTALPRVGIYVIASNEPDRPRHDLKKPWSAIRKRAGLAGLRIHDLRHSFASVGAAANFSLQTIGGLIGHASVATTQRYAHLQVDPVRAAADVIAGRIAEALAGDREASTTPKAESRLAVESVAGLRHASSGNGGHSQ
ncbi:MAG: integrase [Ancylobacter novellus]|uniref:Integrase n=1 Tax=Ancylobacter novellus TaxID=921 RepID=A0A2W5SZ98_ANCNO|nr:MAG: integrase [Ancylobacter novellus]